MKSPNDYSVKLYFAAMILEELVEDDIPEGINPEHKERMKHIAGRINTLRVDVSADIRDRIRTAYDAEDEDE